MILKTVRTNLKPHLLGSIILNKTIRTFCEKQGCDGNLNYKVPYWQRTCKWKRMELLRTLYHNPVKKVLACQRSRLSDRLLFWLWLTKPPESCIVVTFKARYILKTGFIKLPPQFGTSTSLVTTFFIDTTGFRLDTRKNMVEFTVPT